MKEAKVEKSEGLTTNRVAIIYMITNLIEGSEITQIEDRDDAAMLAIHIFDGFEDEWDRQAQIPSAVLSGSPVVKCPKCGAVHQESLFFVASDHVASDEMTISCFFCGHDAPLSEFQVAELVSRISGKRRRDK